MPARHQIVNEHLTPNYHIFSRCVRRAFLCNDSDGSRKQWLENRIAFLTRWFSIDVISYAFMDNHFHLVVHLDTPRMKTWSDREVAYRWAQVFTPKDDQGKPIPPDELENWLDKKEQDKKFLNHAREVLSNLGWFMKSLKEPMARFANKQDDCKGAFWEGRYKSIPILDETALLATCIYIDLNPFSTKFKVDSTCMPVDLEYTSLHLRWQQVKAPDLQNLFPIVLAEPSGDPAQHQAAQTARDSLRRVEQNLTILPIHDGRAQDPTVKCGLSNRLDLPEYMKIVNAVANERQELAEAISPEWVAKLKSEGLDWGQIRDMVDQLKQVEGHDLWGRARGTKEKLNELAAKLGQKKILTHNAKYAQRIPART